MLLLFILLLFEVPASDEMLFGDHVCQTKIIEPREEVKWELKNLTERTYKWCMNVPPRCSVYSNKVVNETKISVINVTKSIEACCEGFREQHGYCISLCQDCKNGLCLKGTCICQSGWTGPNCDSYILNYKESTISETKVSMSSTMNPKDYLTTYVFTENMTDKTSKKYSPTTQQNVVVTDSEEDQISLDDDIIIPIYRTSTSESIPFEKNIVFSTTNASNLVETSTQNINETIVGKKDIPKTISKNNFVKKIHDTSYDTVTITTDTSKFLEEEYLASKYSTEHTLIDTTITEQTQFRFATPSQDNFIETDLNTTTSSGVKKITSVSTHPPVTEEYLKVTSKEFSNNLTDDISANLNSDVDYRELGGESDEGDSVGPPKVLQNGFDKNIIHFKKDGINLDNTVEKDTTENVYFTTWKTTSVLDKPTILKDEKENSISKESSKENLYDLTEERYQKRSSVENYSQNTLLNTNETNNNTLIYSVCAATATTLLILVVAITGFALKSARKKMDKNKEKKDVGTVSVYTTSIFHTPLPDPPTFENPTYLSTGGTETWKQPIDESIEVQEFNVVFQKPLKNPKLDCKQYLYDHPPSTGSYRASSVVDTLSQYNLSQKSLSGIILEPLYDEIPSRENLAERIDEHDVSNNYHHGGQRNSQVNVGNDSLYVNTFGRTVF